MSALSSLGRLVAFPVDRRRGIVTSMGSPPTTFGPYQVLRKLGEGGMGAVFEAMNPAIERRVALKVLHAQYASDPDYAQRFFNEARAVNRVDHPGLVQISDHGRTEEGTAYLVMELLKGETLDKRIKQQEGALPPGEVALLGFQIADSLAAAHEKGIIHRDLKPENVMIVPDPHVAGGERTKLLDFGIAKLLEGAGGRANTKTGTSIGTPYYMSPEQWDEAKGVNAKADVYSLGIMLYEMLTGQLPFQGPGLAPLMGQHMFKDAAPLVDAVPTLPAAFAELVHSMLRKDREQRPDMAQVAEQLHQQAEALPRPARPRRVSSAAITPAPASPSGLDAPTERPTGAVAGQSLNRRIGKRGAVAASVAAVLVLSGGTALWLGRGPGGGSVRPPAPPLQIGSEAGRVEPAAVAPVLRKVRWSIETTPLGSDVIEVATGKSLGKTPLRIELPAESGQQQLRLELAGYADRVISVERDANVSRQEVLQRVVGRPGKKGAARDVTKPAGRSKSAGETGTSQPASQPEARPAKSGSEVPVIE